jgi:hypothetical protein
MADREVLDDLRATGRELDEATAVVQIVLDARDQSVLLRAIHQADDAVSLALQGTGEIADRRISLAGMSTDRQEELVLGRGDALGPCRCLGERDRLRGDGANRLPSGIVRRCARTGRAPLGSRSWWPRRAGGSPH